MFYFTVLKKFELTYSTSQKPTVKYQSYTTSPYQSQSCSFSNLNLGLTGVIIKYYKDTSEQYKGWYYQGNLWEFTIMF